MSDHPAPSRPPTSEVCICAAVLAPDGYIVRGHRHDDCLITFGKIYRYTGIRMEQAAQGFVTSSGRFVDREEGARLQREAGMRSAFHGGLFTGDMLLSEDLY